MKKLIFLIFILILAFLISYFYLQEILNLDSLKQNVNWLMMWASKEIVLSRFVFFISYIIFAGLSFPFLPGATTTKPGSATKPFFGILPVLVDSENNELDGAAEGNLCINMSWPGQMRTVYGDHQRFIDTYFSTFPGRYFSGDGCRRDEDGYFWITGRVDDVINVSGHRMGTAEVESALVAHSDVAEAAVVGYPHDIKGQGIYAYVTVNINVKASEELLSELKKWVRKEIGPIATPDLIQFAPGLPKTRSGKIMRRILRKIAANEHNELGDVSTLADPLVVENLVENRKNI